MRPSRTVELAFALALLALAFLVTSLNAMARKAPGAPRDDAFSELGDRLRDLPESSPIRSVLGAWMSLGLVSAGLVTFGLASKIRRGEKIEDAIREPPPWSMVDFTAVFLITFGVTSIAVPRERLELSDGRSVALGSKPVAVGDATFELKKGVVRVSGSLGVNGAQVKGEGMKLARGDRFVAGGVAGVLLPTTLRYLGTISLVSLVGPLLAIVLVRARGGRLADLGLQGASVREVARGVVGYLAMTPGVILLMYASAALCRALGVPFEGHPLLEGLETDRNPGTLALLLLLTVVIAPVGEEILFRVLLLRSMRSAFGSLALALVASSFFFGALHPGLASLLPIGLVGWVCAMLYATSPRRSIIASMICHGLFNGVNVALDYAILKSSG